MLALSFAALSIAGVWTMVLYGTSLKPLMFCPAALLQAGSWNRSYSTPGSRLPRLMLWWRTRRAPSTGGSFHTGVSLQRFRPVPRPMVLDVLALLSWRYLPALWQVPRVPVYSGLPLQAHFSGYLLWSRSPRACAAGGSLHAGAILAALSAGDVLRLLADR